MNLKNKSYWLNKAIFFSLVVVIVRHIERDLTGVPEKYSARLQDLSGKLPEQFVLSATEGVNNRVARLVRNDFLEKILEGCIAEVGRTSL